jgi:hypothetical protein
MAAFINRVRWARGDMRPPRESREIARLLGGLVGIPVEPNTYLRYETRTPLPLELLLPFCRITGAHIEELLDYEKQSVERDKDPAARERRDFGKNPAKPRRGEGRLRPPPGRQAGTG